MREGKRGFEEGRVTRGGECVGSSHGGCALTGFAPHLIQVLRTRLGGRMVWTAGATRSRTSSPATHWGAAQAWGMLVRGEGGAHSHAWQASLSGGGSPLTRMAGIPQWRGEPTHAWQVPQWRGEPTHAWQASYTMAGPPPASPPPQRTPRLSPHPLFTAFLPALLFHSYRPPLPPPHTRAHAPTGQLDSVCFPSYCQSSATGEQQLYVNVLDTPIRCPTGAWPRVGGCRRDGRAGHTHQVPLDGVRGCRRACCTTHALEAARGSR